MKLDFQQDWTLAEALVFSGRGLHTGQATQVQLWPSKQAGYRLWQADAGWQTLSPAQVTSTRLCTQIGKVMTLEHVLAALYGLGISAVEIRVEGPESPALDGSAACFVDQIQPQALPSQRRILLLKAPWHWQEQGVRIHCQPAQNLSIHYSIDYLRPETQLQQQYHFKWSPEAFAQEIAPARTFAFASDLAEMLSQQRALGGSLDNALLIGTEGIPSTARFADEPVRHKILDLLGDLSLIGGHLQAEIAIHCGGHSSHVTMVKTLLEQGWLEYEPSIERPAS